MLNLKLLPNEQPVAVFRQSGAALLRPTVLASAAAYLPWFFVLKYELLEQAYRLLWFWTFLAAGYLLLKYFFWLMNTNVITTKRLISIVYFGWFSKKVLECPLDKILNISYKVSGLFRTLFRVGDLEVRMAGVSEPMTLVNLKRPAEIKDLLWHTQQNN